jgi:tRNA threonylcarbamoyladenosine biosynthesis protein TsaE
MNSSETISEFFSTSAEETKLWGQNLANQIKAGQVLAFIGDLGVGKTTLIKGLVSTLNNISEEQITSPTFNYLNIYPGTHPIYHFDLYRIQGTEHFLNMGFDEYLYTKDGVTLIEWSEKITPLLPSKTWVVHILSSSENARKITRFCL